MLNSTFCMVFVFVLFSCFEPLFISTHIFVCYISIDRCITHRNKKYKIIHAYTNVAWHIKNLLENKGCAKVELYI